jgi:hypothetical protein
MHGKEKTIMTVLREEEKVNLVGAVYNDVVL